MTSAGQAALRTGQVAELAGVNIQTLRYYERRGLLAEPSRTNGGHRLYPAGTVALLAVIKAAQRLGFTLDSLTNCSCNDCPIPVLTTADARTASADAVDPPDRPRRPPPW